ncbi:ATP-binding cassette domain-containing protein [Arcanobacterium hippocoleae]
MDEFAGNNEMNPAAGGGEFSTCRHRVPGAAPLLEVRDLCVEFSMYAPSARRISAPANGSSVSAGETEKDRRVLKGLTFEIYPGEIVCIVGGSGVGKSVAASAILGLLPNNALLSGDIRYRSLPLDRELLTKLRGRELAYVPQAIDALDPMMKIGAQIKGVYGNDEKLAELFARYRLAEKVADYYPHQLSGGMARRALICGALINSPELIIADEPTPGLDRKLTRQVAADFKIASQGGTAVVIITHNLELARNLADRVLVFADGKINPDLTLADLERAGNLQIPQVSTSAGASELSKSSKSCETNTVNETNIVNETNAVNETNVSAKFAEMNRSGNFRKVIEPESLNLTNISFAYPRIGERILHNVSLQVAAGERVGLLGPSGAGKSTLCKIAAGFLAPAAGEVLCAGKPLPKKGYQPVQMIFQNPELSVNPRLRLGKTLAESGINIFPACEEFGIKHEWLHRYPSEVSGVSCSDFALRGLWERRHDS